MEQANILEKNMSKSIIALLSILLILSIISCYSISSTGEPCPACYGSGKCNYCQGFGSTREEGRCRTCGGRGKCIACNGSGVYTRVIVPGPVY